MYVDPLAYCEQVPRKTKITEQQKRRRCAAFTTKYDFSQSVLLHLFSLLQDATQSLAKMRVCPSSICFPVSLFCTQRPAFRSFAWPGLCIVCVCVETESEEGTTIAGVLLVCWNNYYERKEYICLERNIFAGQPDVSRSFLFVYLHG